MNRISVIIGGHCLSDRAIELIAHRKGITIDAFKTSLPMNYNGFTNKASKDVVKYRLDPDIVYAITTLNDNAFSNTWYKPSIIHIDREFENFIDITNYEGNEYVSIDFANYTIHKIRQVNNNTVLSPEQKQSMIEHLCVATYKLNDYLSHNI